MSERWPKEDGMPMLPGDGMDEDRRLDDRLDRALTAWPEVRVPADFAARVAAAAPEPRTSLAAPSHYGQWALLVCGAVLLLAMFALALRIPHGSRISTAIEMLLMAELIAVAMGAGSWRRAVRWPV